MPEKSRPSVRTFTLAGLLLALLAGCPGVLPEAESRYRDSGIAIGTGGMIGGGTGGAGGAVVACDAVARVFSNGTATACGGTNSCHGTGSPFAPLLTGTDADIWPRLLDKTPGLTTGPCSTGKLVDGANRAASVILKRVSGSDCGALTLMPYGAAAPDQEYVACLTSWVTAHN